MIGPLVGTRIEESAEVARSGDRADVTSFVTIAVHAGISQVFGGCRSAVFFTDDVIDLGAEVGIVFVNEAVFTEPVGSGCNQPPQIRANVGTTHSRPTPGHALSPSS